MNFPTSSGELLQVLLPHEQKIRSNPVLREAIRILAVGFQQGLAEHDPDHLVPAEQVLSVDITENMRAAYTVILEEIRT
jgi:hypothetical protein